VYYDYEEPIRRRPWWPWALALVFVVGAGIGAYFLYHQLSNQLNSGKPVAVDYYVGLRRPDAVTKIHDAGLKVKTPGRESAAKDIGFVVDQDPPAGVRIDKGNTVTIWVGTGPPKREVPDVRGKQSTDAVAAITSAGLKASVHQVPSDMGAGTVLAQDPRPGVKIVEGSSVRINVSEGPKPIAVPNVVGNNVDEASSTLQGAGFAVATSSVDSSEPKGTVVSQNPAPNSSAAKGTTVTLQVSKGPTTTGVPDVTSQDYQSAGQQLHSSGFNVRVQRQDVDDPGQNDIVLSQDPPGGSEQRAGTVVTLVVGRYTGQSTDTTSP
jgi:serine/threonine-protein kinase